MPLSRVRTRAAAIGAAVPLLVAGGPVVTAAAVDGPVTQAVMVSTLGDFRVGPNAGFRGDVARGVNGTTAVMQLDISSASVINTVLVKIDFGKPFSVYQHFSSSDGVAVYKDANDNGRLDESEYTAGPVTRPGYSVSGDGTGALLTLTTDPAKATGASDYLITVHPVANPVADRAVTFSVPAAGIKTSDGDLPSSAFQTADVVVDSLAPSLIPATNFTPVSRPPVAFCPPGSPAGTCGNDGYRVYRGATPAESGAKIGFFNAPGDVSDAALLIAAPGVPAVYDLSSVPALEADKIELNIGNGTGRNPTVAGSKALNNQLTDDVVVAQWDLMCNIASQTFTDSNPCLEVSTNCASQPQRGNDVTGVKPATSYTVKTFNNINANTGSTPAAHPVTGTSTGEDSARAANRLQSTAGQIRQVAVLHRLSDQDTSLHAGAQAWSDAKTPTTAALDFISLINAADDDEFPSPSRVRATLVLVDKVGNPSNPVNSLVRYRDLVKPSFAAISLFDFNANGVPDTGEKYRVVFDDGMDTTKITASNVHTQLDPDNIPGATQCSATTAPPQACPTWGDGATVSWPDTHTLLITLGDLGPPCPASPPNPVGTSDPTCRLAVAGDEVSASTTVTDLAGNIVDNSPFVIENPFVQESDAKTVDAAALAKPAVFGTGRDGIIEAVDVTFSGAVTKSTISDASDAGKFTVQVTGGSTLVASAVGLGGGATSTVARLSFTPPAEEFDLWGTNATPTVKLTTSTIVKSGSQFINAFTMPANDGAPPVPVSMTTQDSNNNGKIDKILVKYSENLSATRENECGYTVTGYGDPAYVPPGSPAPLNATCPMPATPTPRNAFTHVSGQPDTVALTLVEKSTPDTAATPVVSFSATNQVPGYGPAADDDGIAAPACDPSPSLVGPNDPNCPVVDSSGNGLPAFSGTSIDGAAPAIVGRGTVDSDADGHIDALDVTYSEILSTPSVGAAQYEITEPAFTIHKVEQISDTVVRISVFQSTVRLGDTAERPKLKALSGLEDVSDQRNVSSVEATAVQVTDKAGPAIMAGCVAMTIPGTTAAPEKTAQLGKCPESTTGDKLRVFFSEALDTTSGVVAAADFVVEQPAGTPKTIASVSAPVNGSDGKSGYVDITMAANNFLNQTQDAFVKLAATGAVNDNAAAPKNASAQTAIVAAFAPPVVTLAITCPVFSNPGFCAGDYVNTGASGNGGVTGWRLVDSAVAPAMPAPTDFSSVQPTRYPAEGNITEGAHTLWLRGKDDVDRFSPEKSESVTVVRTPRILNFQFVNSTPGVSNGWAKSGTITDGDNMLIGADAYGSDAAEWATAPTGGGCNANKMSIDVRSITGKSNLGKVAPIKCDLKTGGEGPYRQMQFPVFKASNTTRYPVGTVLKTSDSDPGSMIVDGPGGTHRRKAFISVAARRSWMISDASVIKVPTTLINGIPRITPSIGYRDGALLRTGSGYYLVNRSQKRPVSKTQLSAWHISTRTAYSPTSTELRAMSTGTRLTGSAHPAGVWIKYSNGSIYQIVRNSAGKNVRRKLANSAALRTLVPTGHIVPALSADSKLPVDSWLRGYRDGTLLKRTGGTFAIISRGSLRPFANSATFNSMGFNATNALPANGAAMPRVSGHGYRTGIAIDRYKITTAVIKVTNKAGSTATVTIVPSLGGLFALGTFDPAPSGWDFTR